MNKWYTVYAKHPDDGEVKVIVTPWKPDLLDACELAFKTATNPPSAESWNRMIDTLRTAIVKAKGE